MWGCFFVINWYQHDIAAYENGGQIYSRKMSFLWTVIVNNWLYNAHEELVVFLDSLQFYNFVCGYGKKTSHHLSLRPEVCQRRFLILELASFSVKLYLAHLLIVSAILS